MVILLLLTGLLVGMGLSVQTSINSRLRKSVGSPFLTSLISFFVSTLFILILCFFQINNIIIPSSFIINQPWWIWLGGILGLIFLTGNILLFPKLGAVQTVIFPVLGQILAGVIIDQFGLLGAPLNPAGLIKIIGTLLVLSGILCVVNSSKPKTDPTQNNNSKTSLWPWRFLGILTGACSAVQITINGQLGVLLQSSLHAALVSFIVGTITLFIIVCALRPKILLKSGPQTRNPWWMWTGGFLGATYVIGNAYISPVLGTGTTVVIGLLGLMSAGLIIDQTGILQSPQKPVTLKQIFGLIAMFSGVCMIRMLS